MCGLCGIFELDRDRAVDVQALGRMAETLRHRGPDDEGTLVEGALGFAHKRLSIIDLSPSGRQPMTDPSGRFSLMLNGEIYNHQALRQDLYARGHSFRSTSDTEVVLHLFAELGPRCVERLNGMFAFVVWDRQERSLFAARDRLGIKPFYYASADGCFLFASEIKALFESGRLQPCIDRDGLADYLTFQFCLGDKTLFRGVKQLQPGFALSVAGDGTVRTAKYWDVDFTVDLDHTDTYFRTRLAELLEDAVKLQLRTADVPVGAHLSGGLDSSTIACLAAPYAAGGLSTFSGGFREPGYDETRYARVVATHIDAHHHEVFPGPSDFVELMPRLIYHMDQPAAGPGLFPQFAVSKLARESVKVVLGGQGGDEAFGGYTRYLVAYLEECIRGGIEGTQEEGRYVVTFESILPNLRQLDGYQPMLRDFWREGLFGPHDLRYFRLIDRSEELRAMVAPDFANPSYSPLDAFREVFNEGQLGSYINKMTRFDLKTLIPALLHVEDRTSMAVSLESRVPLLDHRIIEFIATVPPMIKYRGGRSKHLFREAVRTVVPDAILDRKDKMGFPVPLTEWYRGGVVADFVRDTLLGARARQRGLFQAACLERLLDAERPYGRTVWGLLSLELWMQAFIDGHRQTA